MKIAVRRKRPRGRPKGKSSDQRSYGPLGDLIRKRRLEHEFGLADVARACSCSVQFISNIEHGRAPLPWDKVKPIAGFLKLPVEQVQAANIAVRSDFQSFTGLSGRRSAEAAVAGIATAAARDGQLQAVIERYSAASEASRKRFLKAALKLLDASVVS